MSRSQHCRPKGQHLGGFLQRWSVPRWILAVPRRWSLGVRFEKILVFCCFLHSKIKFRWKSKVPSLRKLKSESLNFKAGTSSKEKLFYLLPMKIGNPWQSSTLIRTYGSECSRFARFFVNKPAPAWLPREAKKPHTLEELKSPWDLEKRSLFYLPLQLRSTEVVRFMSELYNLICKSIWQLHASCVLLAKKGSIHSLPSLGIKHSLAGLDQP